MTDFANLRALLAGASPEPWFTHPHDVPGEPFPWSSSVFWTGGAQDAVPRVIVARADNPDATLIVEAVNALPGLLDELERLWAALGQMEVARDAVAAELALCRTALAEPLEDEA